MKHRVSVIADCGDCRVVVSVSRVPGLGEQIVIRNVLYEVREVVHHTQSDDYGAEVRLAFVRAGYEQ